MEEVERRGMDEEGIYRVSGGARDIGTLKAAFDSSEDTNISLAYHRRILQLAGAQLHC